MIRNYSYTIIRGVGVEGKVETKCVALAGTSCTQKNLHVLQNCLGKYLAIYAVPYEKLSRYSFHPTLPSIAK